MENLQYVKIREILSGCGSTGEVIAGLVLSKKEARCFQSAKNGSAQQVFSFTLRDSISDWVTVNVWGDDDYVSENFDKFHIGDVVELTNFQVQGKTENHEKFNPYTTSEMTIHVGKRSNGSISLHQGLYLAQMQKLAHYPVCDLNDFFTLDEVSNENFQMSNQSINFLACVKKVGCVQLLKSKTGKDLYKIEIILMDESCNSFNLTIWDKPTCEWASSWKEMSTIIFATDLKVSFSDFKKRVVASSTSRSLFICNPDTDNSRQLFQYVRDFAELYPGVNDSGLGDDVDGSFDSPLVRKTIEEIKREVCSKDGADKAERACLLVAITSFDIDSSDSSRFSSFCCSTCNYSISDENAVSCFNTRCPTLVSGGLFSLKPAYDIRINLSDHTGTLEQCRLDNKSVEDMFQLKLSEFLNLNGSEKTSLKWMWLFERVNCTVRCSLTKTGRIFCKIESCRRATPEENMQYGVKIN